MARLFLSYARSDAAVARQVHRRLVDAGHEVFLDADPRDGIEVGQGWRDRLYAELRAADAVVSLVSSSYRASVWCGHEVAVAQSHGVRLLPLTIEPGARHPLLTSVQHESYVADADAALTAVDTALRGPHVGGGWEEGRNPYPGLVPFDAGDRRVFFGRGEDLQRLASSVRAPSTGGVIVVVGPSGCGKSSLVRAGLVPTIAAEPDWQVLTPVVPGADPVDALAREIAGEGVWLGLTWSPNEVRDLLGSDDGLSDVAAQLLVAASVRHRRRRLLLVVDQFEEVLTLADAARRRRMANLLAAATKAQHVVVVATVRPEFFGSLLNDAGLAGLAVTPVPLRPIDPDGLAEVITGPGRVAGISVPQRLVDRLVKDTGAGDALPMLAFTLHQLAHGVGRGGELSEQRYEELGGVAGTLIRQADVACAAASAATGRDRQAVLAGLLRLVDVDDRGQPTRHRVSWAELPEAVRAEVAVFVDGRLLTTETVAGVDTVGVAHEAFLSAWPPLAEAIARTATGLRSRRDIEKAADDWHTHGRTPERLWQRGQLAAAAENLGARLRRAGRPFRRGALSWHLQTSVDLTRTATDFLRTSIIRDRRRRRSVAIALSAALLLAITVTVVTIESRQEAVEERQRAQAQQQLATARQLISQAEALRGRDLRTALRIGIAANRIRPGNESQAALFSTLTGTPIYRTFLAHTDITNAVFSADRRVVAAAHDDRTVSVWDLTDVAKPKQVRWTATGGATAVQSLALSPDGRTLATALSDGAVDLWDLTDTAGPRRIGRPLTVAPDGMPPEVAFSPRDGRILATAGLDRAVILWDLTDPTHPRRTGRAASASDVFSVLLSPDGRSFVTLDSGGSALLWDITDPARPRRIGAPFGGSYKRVSFSGDGRMLAGLAGDRTVTLWDLTRLDRPRSLANLLASDTGSSIAIAFSPDGRTLATPDGTTRIVLWDLSDPKRPRRIGEPLTGHGANVSALAFRDASSLVTVNADRTFIAWDLAARSQPTRLGQPLAGPAEPVVDMALSGNDGRMLAAVDVTRAVTLWDLRDRANPRRAGRLVADQPDGVLSAALSPDGRTVAAVDFAGRVTLWDLTLPAEPTRVGRPFAGITGDISGAVFAPDGHTLATAGTDKKVVLWDLTDRADPRPIGQPLSGHTERVMMMVFSPDGRMLATAAPDRQIIVWDMTDRRAPHRVGEPIVNDNMTLASAGFSQDGQTFAASSRGEVNFWDLHDRQHVRLLGRHNLIDASDAPITVAFSPDLRTLTASGRSGFVLWDATDPAHLHVIGRPNGGARLATFSPDGQTIATVDTAGSGLVELWDLSRLYQLRADTIEAACAAAGRGLSRDEWARYISGLEHQETCPDD